MTTPPSDDDAVVVPVLVPVPGPKGEPGAKGNQGGVGPQGPEGARGDSGVDGLDGHDGIAGVDGRDSAGSTPQRRAEDSPYILAEIRREELARLASIDANNKRLAEATEALILALENFATKEEVNLKVDAVEAGRTIVIRRVVAAFIVVGVLIALGIVSTVTYAASQHRYHHRLYENCLTRNTQVDALRNYAQHRIEANQRNLAHLPQAVVDQAVKDLTDLKNGYTDVDCTKS